MFKFSPAAEMFWGSVIRHALSGIGAIVVAHGYATKNVTDAYVEELVGASIWGGSYLWSNRVTYWTQIKHLVARAMPAGTTDEQIVAKIVELKAAGSLPSVFTPPNVPLVLYHQE